MATVTGLTAQRMLEVEAASVVDGDVVGGSLILTKHDGSQINAGPVVGPAGPQGPPGVPIIAIPGQIILWPGSALPDPVKYGKWAWCNGDPYDIATYPDAAENIDDSWNTAHGQATPGAGKFRVPDLRGLTPVCLDAMPVGATRANRVTRASGIVMGGKTGEELHKLIIAEQAKHGHVFAGNPVAAHGHAGSTFAGNALPGHVHQVDMNYNRVSTGAGGGSTNYMTGMTGQSAGTVAFSSNSDSASAGTPSGSVTIAAGGAHTPSGTVQDSGSDTPHENMQPTVFVPYIVKLDD